jgi:uncharacterized protein YkwD
MEPCLGTIGRDPVLRIPRAMGRRRAACVALVGTVLLLAPAAAASACAGEGSMPTEATLDRAAAAVACLVNAERVGHGVAPLRAVGVLGKSAGAHSRDMVRRHFFSHTGPGGSTPARRVARTGYLHGARSWAVGETIAWGSGRLGTPVAVVRAWMGSADHRPTLLDRRYHDLGIGFALGEPEGGGGATVTADLAARG